MFIKKNFLNIFLKKILKKFWIYKFLGLKNFLTKIFGFEWFLKKFLKKNFWY